VYVRYVVSQYLSGVTFAVTTRWRCCMKTQSSGRLRCKLTFSLQCYRSIPPRRYDIKA